MTAAVKDDLRLRVATATDASDLAVSIAAAYEQYRGRLRPESEVIVAEWNRTMPGCSTVRPA